MKVQMNPCAIVKATPAHALALAPKLDKGTLYEMDLHTPGRAPSSFLLDLLDRAPDTWAALDGAEVVAIGGFSVEGTPGLPYALPWVLQSGSFERHREQLELHTKALVDKCSLAYPNPACFAGTQYPGCDYFYFPERLLFEIRE